MKSLNQVTVLGNIVRDLDLKNTSNGKSVISFSLALNRSYKDGTGEWKESVDFVDVVAYGFLADNLYQYSGKGKKVLVQGRLSSRSWEKDGRKYSKLEVFAENIIYLSVLDKKEKEDTVYPVNEDEPINLDDIPF